MFTVCGKKALDPVAVAELCRENPLDEVYCLPWVETEEQLMENLKVNKGKPNRAAPFEHNTDELWAESVEMEENLKTDVYGRMGFLIKNGLPVVNQVMKTGYRTDFYGNIMERGPGAKRYIVSADDMDKYFPHEPLSAKLYAATTVFVRMKGTEEFAELAGSSEVDVMFGTPFIPGAQEFMGFLKLMTGNGVIASIRPYETFPRKNIALFRYNKGYTIPYSDYVKMSDDYAE